MKKIISIITITLLLFSCGKKEETAKEEFEVVAAENQITLNDNQIKNAGIETGNLGYEDISAKIILNGALNEEELQVQAEVLDEMLNDTAFMAEETTGKKGNKGTFIAKFNVSRSEYNVGKKGNDVADLLKITATLPVQKK